MSNCYYLLLSVVLTLLIQAGLAIEDDFNDDDEELEVASQEVVDSFPNVYRYSSPYPWPLWNSYQQPLTRAGIPDFVGDAGEERSRPVINPRFVTNNCNPRNYVTPTPTCHYTSVTYITSTVTVTVTPSLVRIAGPPGPPGPPGDMGPPGPPGSPG